MSCPSCGRTLFDLQEISAEIREKTSHLPGVSVRSLIPEKNNNASCVVEWHNLTLLWYADCHHGLHCQWTRRNG